MSDHDYDPMAEPVRQGSALGIASFVCSLVGLLLAILTGIGGLLCVVGILIGLVAVGRRPRGFAIAGLILGVLGTCVGVIVFIAISAMFLAVAGIAAAGVVASDPERLELTSDMIAMAIGIEHFKKNNGALPATIDEVNLRVPVLMDPWGGSYKYQLMESEPGYDILTAGPDGTWDTADDASLSRIDEIWDGWLEDFKDRMEELEQSGGVTITIPPKSELPTDPADAPDPADPEDAPDPADQDPAEE